MKHASYFFCYKYISVKGQNSCDIQLMGLINQVKGAKYTIHPAGSVDHPWKPVKTETGKIFMNVTLSNKSLHIAYLYFSILKTTSYFVFSYEVYLTRYCGFKGGPLAQQGVDLAPSTRLIGSIVRTLWEHQHHILTSEK